jgi:hypothetical protein
MLNDRVLRIGSVYDILGHGVWDEIKYNNAGNIDRYCLENLLLWSRIQTLLAIVAIKTLLMRILIITDLLKNKIEDQKVLKCPCYNQKN